MNNYLKEEDVFLKRLLAEHFSGRLFFDYWKNDKSRWKSLQVFERLTDSQMLTVISNMSYLKYSALKEITFINRCISDLEKILKFQE
jgi:hypothetical protein